MILIRLYSFVSKTIFTLSLDTVRWLGSLGLAPRGAPPIGLSLDTVF